MKQPLIDAHGKTVGQLTGPWWLNDSPIDPETEYPAQEAFFRIEFSAVTGAQFQLATSDYYQLWLNGQRLGSGPARASHGRLTVDAWALPPELLREKNTLAVQVFWEGIFTFDRVRSAPGLWYALTDASGDLLPEIWITDQTGRIVTQTASVVRGWTEEIDARQRTPNWPAGPWTAAHWRKPVERTTNPAVVLEQRDIKPFAQRLDRAQFVTFAGACDPKSRTPHRPLGNEGTPGFAPPADAPSSVIQEEALAPTTAHDDNLAALTASDPGIATLGPDPNGLDRTIQLDFGQLVTGTIELRIEAPAGTVVDFGWAEGHWEDERMGVWARSPHPDGSVASREFADGRSGARYICSGHGIEIFQGLYLAAFRHLRIAFRVPGSAAPIRIHDLAVRHRGYPIAAQGAFRCSDDSLNRIHRAAVHTMECSIDDVYMDCPGRERAAWLNDSYWTSIGFLDLTGDIAYDRRFIRQFIDSQDAMSDYEGNVAPIYPADCRRWRARPTGQGPITGHSFYWLLQLERHLRLFGDAALKEKWRPAVERLIAGYQPYINAEGLLENKKWDAYFDWSDVQSGPIFTPDNFLFSFTLARLGQCYNRADWQQLSARMAGAVDRLAWNPDRELYTDNIARTGDQLSLGTGYSCLTNYVALWTAMGEPARAERIWRQLKNFHPATLDRQLISYETSLVRGNLFALIYRFDYAARRGELDTLLRDLSETYLPMFERGQTTLSEHLGYHGSLCHAYNGYVVHLINRHIAGIELPENPGDLIRIRPHPELISWCQARVVWRHGLVQVWWSKVGSQIELFISIPAGQTAELILGQSAPIPFTSTLHTKLPSQA
jgi:hypothetical protein